MPHISGTRYAVVSCHVERPLDDRVWRAFERFQRRRPGGFRIAALLRPPDPAAGESDAVWLERARLAAARGPLGHHTHWTAVDHARPTDPNPAARVRSEGEWILERGLRPTVFCGGGWYMDDAVARAAAELGYADCTATSYRPAYLPEGAPRIELDRPGRLALADGRELLELPTTHSIGMAFRAAFRFRLRGAHVHVYFHDTDLLDRRRRVALRVALAVLGRRCRVSDLDELRSVASTGPQEPFALAA